MTDEILGKRIEMLEKNFRQLIEEINTKNRFSIVNSKSELYHYAARGIKNEAELDMIKEFLINKSQMNYLEYYDFRKNNDLLRTYVDENKTILELMNYYEKLKSNPSAANNVEDYVSGSSLIAIKNRIQIKRANAIKRGLVEDSDAIKDLDSQIEEVEVLLKSLLQKKKKEVIEQEYFVKKQDAEKLFDSFSNKKDEIIERVRQVPQISELQMEPQNRSLYYEVICNYWFGNFNASILLLSVLVESFLKEIYFFKEKKHSEETLIPLIETCGKRHFITDPEKERLSNFAETIRNNYLHGNLHKIVEKITLPAYVIELTNPDATPKPTYVTEESLPVIRAIAKHDIDKERSRTMIVEIYKELAVISARTYSEQSDQAKPNEKH